MKPVLSAASLVFVWALAVVAHSQTVLIGPNGKVGSPPATAEYCASVEPLRPNLVLTHDTSIRGRISDETSAPFSSSAIELRRFVSETKQVKVKTVSTDGDGNFDLGIVRRGDYRLLLSPHRGFKQPERLECWSKHCTIDEQLIANPTDEPAASCPIR